MSKSTWGGKREGAGSGGKREGAGRPRTTTTLRKGDHLVMERETMGGKIKPPQMWQVLSIGGDDGNVIEFQCGNDIIVLRPPDG